MLGWPRANGHPCPPLAGRAPRKRCHKGGTVFVGFGHCSTVSSSEALEQQELYFDITFGSLPNSVNFDISQSKQQYPTFNLLDDRHGTTMRGTGWLAWQEYSFAASHWRKAIWSKRQFGLSASSGQLSANQSSTFRAVVSVMVFPSRSLAKNFQSFATRLAKVVSETEDNSNQRSALSKIEFVVKLFIAIGFRRLLPLESSSYNRLYRRAVITDNCT